MPLVTACAGLALVAVGIVYCVVACESLPGFLGPTPGDASPRTGLGIAVVVLGLSALAAAAIVAWRRSSHRG
jgi:hypothetical protein